MNSLRRELIDKFLFDNQDFIIGNILDVGGAKTKRRGKFKPFKNQKILSWDFVNKDSKLEPDYLIDLDKEILIKNKKFDTLIMTEVIEYLNEPKYTFKELNKLMNDDGVMIITSPFLNPIHGDYMYDKARYSEVAIKQIAYDSGFTVVKIETMGSLGTVVFDILRISFSRNNNKILFRILKLFKFLFKFLDKCFYKVSKYVNSGYFIILKKNK